MKRPFFKHPWFWFFLILAAVLFFVSTPWSSRYQDIDLDTGRVRDIRMLFGIPIRAEILHTPISEALGIQDLESPTGDWRRVNSFSGGSGISPHYVYHGAISQAHNLRDLWLLYGFSPEAREHSASTVLKLWKQSGGKWSAGDYIDRLFELGELKKVTVSDIAALEAELGLSEE